MNYFFCRGEVKENNVGIEDDDTQFSTIVSCDAGLQVKLEPFEGSELKEKNPVVGWEGFFGFGLVSWVYPGADPDFGDTDAVVHRVEKMPIDVTRAVHCDCSVGRWKMSFL